MICQANSKFKHPVLQSYEKDFHAKTGLNIRDYNPAPAGGRMSDLPRCVAAGEQKGDCSK